MGGGCPVLFVLGPSGSGKSTLGGWIAEDLGFLRLEMDLWGRDGTHVHGLRKEWDAYWSGADATSLAAAIAARAEQDDRSGAVLTFPSALVPRRQHRLAAERAAICLLVLYGTGDKCLDAFLRSEADSSRGLDEDYWVRHNARPYAEFSRPAFAPYRLDVFADGGFRARSDLVAEVAGRLGPRVGANAS